MNYTHTKIACYLSCFIQAINISFLPLLYVTFNEAYGISYEKLGLLSVFSFVLQLGVDLISVKLLCRIGYRAAAISGNLLSAIGFVMLAVLPRVLTSSFLAVIAATAVYSLGSGLIEVIMSPIIEYLPTKNKAAQMSLLHSFFCWGQVLTITVSTLLLLALGRRNWYYIALLWALVGLINAVLFTRVPIIDPEKTNATHSAKGVLRSPVFYGVMLLMLAAGASELSVSSWASAFAERGLSLSKTVGDLLGPCCFAVLMGVGRLLYGLYGEKIKIEKALFLSGAVCFAGYLILFLNISPVLSLVATALIGLSVSLMWPGALSLGAARFQNSATLLFGFAAAFGDTGCSVGPYIMGVMTERSSMQSGFLICSVFPLLIIVIAACFLKYSCKKTENVLK